MAGQIFVSIASYRDNQCQYTIQDLFREAKFPKRVIVGVCFQVSKDDTDNFLLDLDPWCGQIRSHFVEHSAAKGPCIARAWTQDLYRGEEYYFQIDSHMRFVQNWDVLCIQQLQQCKTPKAILTTYASSYTLPKTYIAGAPDCAELAPNKALPILCADRFGDENQDDPFLRIKTRSCRKDFESPPPALFWTARFAFSRGEVVQDVPYDPHLEYVFFGEEISMSARLWTSGWDFFHPTSEIAYHLASRAHRYWFREVQSTPEQLHREKQGKFRICGLLGTPWPDHHVPPEKPYGVGSQRTLAEYEDFAGVRFADCILEPRATLGGQPAQLFAPLWADEQREKMLLTNQLKDIESWAGKGNLSEANLDFVKKLWLNGAIPNNRDRPNPVHDDAEHGPNLYQVNDYVVKPMTLAAGGMSYALMKHPQGLDCHVFISHSWHEGIFHLQSNVRSAWPQFQGCRNLYCCLLANPQNLDINELLGGANGALGDSPFAQALSRASHLLVVPNPTVCVYSRLWCVYEAFLGVQMHKTYLFPVQPKKGAVAKELAKNLFPSFLGVLCGIPLMLDFNWNDRQKMSKIGYLICFFYWFSSTLAQFCALTSTDRTPRLKWIVRSLLALTALGWCITMPWLRWCHAEAQRKYTDLLLMAILHYGGPLNMTITNTCMVYFFSRQQVEDEESRRKEAMMQFQSVRSAQCSCPHDEDRIRRAIEGSEEEVDKVIGILVKAGAYTDGLREAWEDGLDLQGAGYTNLLSSSMIGMLGWTVVAADSVSDALLVHCMELNHAWLRDSFLILSAFCCLTVLVLPCSLIWANFSGPDRAFFVAKSWATAAMWVLLLPMLTSLVQGYDAALLSPLRHYVDSVEIPSILPPSESVILCIFIPRVLLVMLAWISAFTNPMAWVRPWIKGLRKRCADHADVHGYEKQNRQEAQMRDVARMRIDALLSKLPGAEVELELCKAFANLAQLEHSNGEPAGAVAQAAHYLSLAKGAKSTALWEASTAVAEASVRMAQHDFAAAKVVLLSAADALGEALETGHEALQVTQDIMEAIHRCYERTDDRKGLEKYHASLKATLEALRRLQPETPQEVPSLTAACPPPQDAGDVPSVLAVLLERMVLLLVATGRERDMELVKTIYESFQVARESPSLLRLLAMLQSSGNLLKTK
eukprot:symbB.v1.2.027034.t1/scaffold2746.1/size71737/3